MATPLVSMKSTLSQFELEKAKIPMPSGLILETMIKRGRFICESVGELLLKLDVELQKQVEVLEYADGEKAYTAKNGDEKIIAELTTIQAKAAELGEKKYAEYLQSNFGTVSIEFMSKINELSRNFYDEKEDGEAFINFLLRNGYSAQDTCKLFVQFTKHATAERQKYDVGTDRAVTRKSFI